MLGIQITFEMGIGIGQIDPTTDIISLLLFGHFIPRQRLFIPTLVEINMPFER
ncbi:hypothetical protein THIOM_001668 [Candidatus Thiomargarita nelsonii]|uniref:Uncharacterized protein n=1 Tax=Candidatus Thiomargarita nelsonii TaxID=1003181 RepID=A0A176S3E4_9GAMM|nr:hypothetical protein THIOM_001668 [Candidatus Thiomargarita nelsonii]